jgi:microcystin-dependent protein
MSAPYIGEIRMFGGNFAPLGWAFCNGQIIPIDQNEFLFNLIGTTYGGDGQLTFALPNLQSRVPIHQGPGFFLAQQGGAEQVSLTSSQIPAHSHALNADENAGTQLSPAGNVLAQTQNPLTYRALAPALAMDPRSVRSTGGNQPHDNMLPFVVVNFIIALEGIYPSQN